MELVITIISLLWVIGIVSIQRIDIIIKDFISALAFYVSINPNTTISKEQLEINSLLPQSAMVPRIKVMITSTERKDKEKLKECVSFIEIADRFERSIELLLISATIILPGIYLIDFSKLEFITWLNKSLITYLFLVSVTLVALISERILISISSKRYPLVSKVTL